VARETVTLDWLSSGRLTFGAGLGSARNDELEPYGEVTDPRERAELLDQGLDALARYWAGAFEPLPVQRPRPPVWVAGEWPNRRPVRRALRWDGLFTIGLPGPEALAGLAATIRESRPDGQFELVTELPPDTDLGPWERAGLTWAVTDFGVQPTEAAVRAVIEAGPGSRAEGSGRCAHCPLRAPGPCHVITADGRALTASRVEAGVVGQFRRRFPPGMCRKVRRAGGARI
jgi:hypothetical protein